MTKTRRRAIYRRMGENIRTRREYMGWTQEWLAKALRISRPSLANIEAGRQGISVARMLDICEQLGCKPQLLFSKSTTEGGK